MRRGLAAVGLALAAIVAACGQPTEGNGPAASTGGPVAAGARAVRGACVQLPAGQPCAAETPMVGGCSVFPASNWWNTDVSGYLVHPSSARFLARIAELGGDFLHPDFGSNPSSGIPYVVVPASQPRVPITYTPARHFASSSTDPDLPPMGLRLRLRAGYDISGFRGQARVVLEALRRHGMLVADNGSNWYITGARDARWDEEDLDQLKRVPASAFEVVDTGPILR